MSSVATRGLACQEIVELVLTAAFYNCVSRTLLALEVPLVS